LVCLYVAFLASKLVRAVRLGFSIRLVYGSYYAWSFLRLVLRGLRLVFILVNALTILSSIPDHLVEHVSSLVHLGGVEHQVGVVVLRRDRRLDRGMSMTLFLALLYRISFC